MPTEGSKKNHEGTGFSLWKRGEKEHEFKKDDQYRCGAGNVRFCIRRLCRYGKCGGGIKRKLFYGIKNIYMVDRRSIW